MRKVDAMLSLLALICVIAVSYIFLLEKTQIDKAFFALLYLVAYTTHNMETAVGR